jgi:hypothetical protein
MMKAQASLEYLLLTVVALSLVSISAMALMGLKDSAEDEAAMLRFRGSSDSLAGAIRSVCALGSGNQREVALDEAMSVYSEGNGEGYLVRFSGAGISVVKESRCRLDCPPVLEGRLIVKNEGGVVSVRGQ